MKRVNKTDDFFYKQPELLLVDLLKEPLYKELPMAFGMRDIEEGEVSVKGMFLRKEFDDVGGLLDTAYKDFEDFTTAYQIGGDRFPVITKRKETSCLEEYVIEVSGEAVTIFANDTEGIRRGIFWLEDEIKAREGAFLPKGTITRTPHIRKRITRGVFSPTNRAPKFGDELSDNIDYYPEEYLNRLAHDGSNAIWIYTRFSDIIPSAVIEEYGRDYQRRIDKLNKVCDKCEKYGIGVYVFAIEPEAPTDEKIIKKYSGLLGTVSSFAEFRKANGNRAFCTHTKLGREYCIDATKKLCTLVPKLAGFISITAGERITSCAAEAGNTCPVCGHIDRGESLAQTIDCLKEGMRQSGSAAEFISWTYGHRTWENRDISDYVKYAPSDIMLMQNFEDMGYAEQLGKIRQGVDYWLSYPGPSGLFEHTAAEAQRMGKHMYAKMQVCTSHEVATLPYIPTPGIIFDKFKGAYHYGVEGVMESWYFGNYPSIMSKAAGELAFYYDFADKDKFLNRLASIYCGRTNAKKLTEAWKCFEEGYKNYPLNVMFSYYGPMHDGICWELYLKPRNFSLSRSWLMTDRTDGDRIYEALMCGHTLEETIILSERMCSSFEKGIGKLANAEIPLEHTSVIQALYVLFLSGTNILKFYKMREQLGFGEGDASNLLEEMRKIVIDEIRLSEMMIKLCEDDKRLGYHSEAEAYKFFPEKIKDRINKLHKLLETEFSEVRERIEKNLLPLEYYAGVEEDAKHYNMVCEDISFADWEFLSDGSSKFCASYDKENLYIKVCGEGEIVISPEFVLMHPYPPIVIKSDGTVNHGYDAKLYYALFDERFEDERRKWKTELCEDGILLTLSRKEINWESDRPLKVSIKVGKVPWCVEQEPVYTLGKQTVSPGEYGWLMP